MLTEPERLHLARLNTPLESYQGLLSGRELLVKRDDLTGSALSGNKIRKLEYLLADALAAGAERVVTCGAIQSNHCRATVLAAAKIGLKAKVYLKTKTPPVKGSTPRGNLALMHMAGAEIVFVSHEWYAQRATHMQKDANPEDYLIPEGGSNALGAWGYIRAVAELKAQWREPPTSIVVATGSGGTVAGLVLGLHLHHVQTVPVYGVCACDDASYFQRECARISEQAHLRWRHLPSLPPSAFDFVEGYVGEGYALSTPAERADLRRVMRQSGLVLDPVYTNKAFRALLREPERFGERPLFIHTGGIFGLLA